MSVKAVLVDGMVLLDDAIVNERTIIAGASPGPQVDLSTLGNGALQQSVSGGVATLSVYTPANNLAKFIIQQPDASLPNAQSLSALTTGLVKNTTTTGVLSIAVDGVDYFSPATAFYPNPGTGPSALGGVGTAVTLARGDQVHAAYRSDLPVSAAWFVDPVSGSDAPSNPGTTNATALATLQELKRRWWGADITVNTTVTILGNIPSSDNGNWNFTIAPGVTVQFIGSLGATTGFGGRAIDNTVFSGSVTSFVAMGSAPAVEDAQLTDTSVPVSFTASGLMASGIIFKRTNSTAWYWYAAKDLGAKTIRVSIPQPTNITNGANAALTPGDTYTAYQLWTMPTQKFGPAGVSPLSLIVDSVMDNRTGAQRLGAVDIVNIPGGYRRTWFSTSTSSWVLASAANCALELGAGGGLISANSTTSPVGFTAGGMVKGTGSSLLSYFGFAGNSGPILFQGAAINIVDNAYYTLESPLIFCDVGINVPAINVFGYLEFQSLKGYMTGKGNAGPIINVGGGGHASVSLTTAGTPFTPPFVAGFTSYATPVILNGVQYTVGQVPPFVDMAMGQPVGFPSQVIETGANTLLNFDAVGTNTLVYRNGALLQGANVGTGLALAGGTLSATTGSASWALNVTRFFAVDGVNGNDANTGFSDVSSAAAGAVAKKTLTGIGTVIPPAGAGRTGMLYVANGGVNTAQSYPEAATFLEQLHGYAYFGVSGTGTNGNAGAVAFDGSANTQLYGGGITVPGLNAAGYNPTGAATTTSIPCTLNGGGAPGLPAEPAAPLGWRIRFDINTATVALRGICKTIVSVSGGTTLGVLTALTTPPSASDVFYIEKAGVLFTNSFFGIGATDTESMVIAGIDFQGSIFFYGGVPQLMFCGSNSVVGGRTNVMISSNRVLGIAQAGAVITNRGMGGSLRNAGTYQNGFAGAALDLQVSTWIGMTEILCGGGGNSITDGTVFGGGVVVHGGYGDTNWNDAATQFGGIAVPVRFIASGFNVGFTAGLQLRGCSIQLRNNDFQNMGAHPAIVLVGMCNLMFAGTTGLTGSTGNSDVGMDLLASQGSRIVLHTVPTVTGTLGDVRLSDGTIVTWTQAASGIIDAAGNSISTTAGWPIQRLPAGTYLKDLAAGGPVQATSTSGLLFTGPITPAGTTGIVANWPTANVRWYALDGTNGNDANIGYSDVSSAAAGLVAKQTMAGLAAVVPRIGEDRKIAIVVRSGNYAGQGGLDLFLSSMVGYGAGYPVVVATDTNSTAGAVAFAGDANDRTFAGGTTATGTNGAGYTPVGTLSASLVQCVKSGGGAPGFGAEPAVPLFCRMRFDVATTTVALRNQCRMVYAVPASDTLTPLTPFGATPVTSDVFYLEQPNCVVDSSTVNFDVFGQSAVVGFRTTGTFTLWHGNVTFAFCESATFNLQGGNYKPTPTYSDETGASRNAGMGMRLDGNFVSSAGGQFNLSLQQPAFGATSGVSLSAMEQFGFTNGSSAFGGIFVSGTGGPVWNNLSQPACTVGGRSHVGEPIGRVRGTFNAVLPAKPAGVQIMGARVVLDALDIEGMGANPAIAIAGQSTVSLSSQQVGSTGNTDVGLDLTQSYGSTIILTSQPTVTGTAGDVRLGNGTIITWVQAIVGVQDSNNNRLIGPAAYPIQRLPAGTSLLDLAAGGPVSATAGTGLLTVGPIPATGTTGIVATWAAAVRTFLYDPVNGNDANPGFSDVAGPYNPATLAKQTVAGLQTIVPKHFAGKTFRLLVASGTYASSDLDTLFAGATGIGSGSVIRATSTNATASATAFADDTNDRTFIGATTATSCNVAGYNPTAGATTGSIPCQLNGGGAAGFAAEPASPLLWRVRFNSTTTTVALRNVCRTVIMVSGGNTISLDAALPAVPVTSDVFYLEMGGASFPTVRIGGTSSEPTTAGGISNGLQLAGIRSVGACVIGEGYFTLVLFGAGSLISRVSNLQFKASYFDPVASGSFTVGGGMRSEGSLIIQSNTQVNGGNMASVGETSLLIYGQFTAANCIVGAGMLLNTSALTTIGTTNLRILGPEDEAGIEMQSAWFVTTDTSNSVSITGCGSFPAIKPDGVGNRLQMSSQFTGSSGNTDVGLDLTSAYDSTVLLTSQPTVTGAAGDVRLGGGTIITWAQAIVGISDTHGNRFIGPTAFPIQRLPAGTYLTDLSAGGFVQAAAGTGLLSVGLVPGASVYADGIVTGTAKLTLISAALLQAGTIAYVNSVDDSFQLQANTQTPDNITIVAALGKAGFNWVRLGVYSARWAAVTAWTLDPANVSTTASDENPASGNLLTYSELARRLSQVVFTAPITITVTSDQQASDKPVFTYKTTAEQQVTFLGVPTLLYTGSVTSYATATVGGTDDNQLVDSAIPVSFTASGLMADGVLFQRTSGTPVAWYAAKDLGAKTVRVSWPFNLSSVLAINSLSPGDTYTASALPLLSFGNFPAGQEFGTIVKNLKIARTNAPGAEYLFYQQDWFTAPGRDSGAFYNCAFSTNYNWGSNGGTGGGSALLGGLLKGTGVSGWEVGNQTRWSTEGNYLTCQGVGLVFELCDVVAYSIFFYDSTVTSPLTILTNARYQQTTGSIGGKGNTVPMVSIRDAFANGVTCNDGSTSATFAVQVNGVNYHATDIPISDVNSSTFVGPGSQAPLRAGIVQSNASGILSLIGVGTGLSFSGGVLSATGGTINGITSLLGDGTATGPGAATFRLVNIPDGTTAAGQITYAMSVAPASPALGFGALYADASSQNIAFKNHAGTVNHGVQTAAVVAHNFLTAIDPDGTVHAAQPVIGDLQAPPFTLLGNPTGVTAAVQGITLGAGLAFSGTTLIATGGGGSGTVTTVTGTAPIFITSTPTTTPNVTIQGAIVSGSTSTAAQNLGLLTTGLLKGTVASSISTISTAVAGTDYEVPLTFSTGLTRSVNTITANLSTGVSGGQNAVGGTGAGESLFLSSTTSGTKGKIFLGNTSNYFDENATAFVIGTTSPVAGVGVQFNKSQNAGTTVYVTNPNAGGGANSGVILGNTTSSFVQTFGMYLLGTGFTPTGLYLANTGILQQANTSANMIFSLFQTAGDFVWTTNTSIIERMRLTQAGVLSVVNLNAGGLVKAAVTTGVLSVAVSGVDYQPAGNYITALTTDVTATGPGSAVATISNHAVTYIKMQQASLRTLLGNPTAGTANIQEITLGTNLSFSGSVLNATGGTSITWPAAGEILYSSGTGTPPVGNANLIVDPTFGPTVVIGSTNANNQGNQLRVVPLASMVATSAYSPDTFLVDGQGVTITSPAHITYGGGWNTARLQPTTYSAGSAMTIDSAATVKIEGDPVGGTNVTITSPYALWVGGGHTRLDGPLRLSTVTGPALLQVDASGNVSAGSTTPFPFASYKFSINTAGSVGISSNQASVIVPGDSGAIATGAGIYSATAGTAIANTLGTNYGIAGGVCAYRVNRAATHFALQFTQLTATVAVANGANMGYALYSSSSPFSNAWTQLGGWSTAAMNIGTLANSGLTSGVITGSCSVAAGDVIAIAAWRTDAVAASTLSILMFSATVDLME